MCWQGQKDSYAGATLRGVVNPAVGQSKRDSGHRGCVGLCGKTTTFRSMCKALNLRVLPITSDNTHNLKSARKMQKGIGLDALRKPCAKWVQQRTSSKANVQQHIHGCMASYWCRAERSLARSSRM